MSTEKKEVEAKVRDIIDKLGFLDSNNKKVFMHTKPSATFPKGKIYIGSIKLISSTYIEIIDDRESFCRIYYSEIDSPTDVQESTKEEFKP